MKNKIKKITLALLIFLTIFTVYLSISELSGDTVCLVNSEQAKAGCSSVQNSSYGKIAGIKVTYLGTIATILLLATLILANTNNKYKQNFKEIYILGTILGALGAVYFLSIQAFVLKTFCSSCIVVDSTIILISVLSWISYKR